jgi:hypothetical protein
MWQQLDFYFNFLLKEWTKLSKTRGKFWCIIFTTKKNFLQVCFVAEDCLRLCILFILCISFRLHISFISCLTFRLYISFRLCISLRLRISFRFCLLFLTQTARLIQTSYIIQIIYLIHIMYLTLRILCRLCISHYVSHSDYIYPLYYLCHSDCGPG